MIERIATLHEIETHWSITDLQDANDALDCMAEARAEEAKRQASSKPKTTKTG